jgi:spore coat protein H
MLVTAVACGSDPKAVHEAPGGSSACDGDAAWADARGLFEWAHVPTFDLHLPADEWTRLQQNAREEEYTAAEACFEGGRIGTIGLRFKGAHGTLYNCFDETGALVCDRLSMKLKFDEFFEDQRFFGLKRLNFNANRFDDSRMKERLAYDLYRAADVVAPRASWAVVRVNGQSLGLYGMVEQLDGRFTADRWPENPDGNLFKEVWPTDTDEERLVAALSTNEQTADVSGFSSFAAAVVASPEDQVLNTLGAHTDVEYWARYMAVDDAVVSYDGVTYFYTDGAGSHNHNYYFYEHSPSSFTLVPWDVESTFWINPAHAAPHWTVIPEDCSRTYPYWEGLATAPGCDRVFRALSSHAPFRDRWRAAARQLLDGPFALDAMLANVDRHAAFIGDEARAQETPTMYSSFDDAVGELRRVIPELRARLEQLIAETNEAD